jgi:hypothetical protein
MHQSTSTAGDKGVGGRRRRQQIKGMEDQVDGRQWHKERLRWKHNNQSGWTLKGSSETTGRGADRQEAAAWWDAMQYLARTDIWETTTPENKRGMTGGKSLSNCGRDGHHWRKRGGNWKEDSADWIEDGPLLATKVSAADNGAGSRWQSREGCNNQPSIRVAKASSGWQQWEWEDSG